MRYRAVLHLGLETVPAILEDIPESLAKERALRDNAQWGEVRHSPLPGQRAAWEPTTLLKLASCGSTAREEALPRGSLSSL